MDKFKRNVAESFKRAKEDALKMQFRLDMLEKQNLELIDKVAELNRKLLNSK